MAEAALGNHGLALVPAKGAHIVSTLFIFTYWRKGFALGLCYRNATWQSRSRKSRPGAGSTKGAHNVSTLFIFIYWRKGFALGQVLTQRHMAEAALGNHGLALVPAKGAHIVSTLFISFYYMQHIGGQFIPHSFGRSRSRSREPRCAMGQFAGCNAPAHPIKANFAFG